MKKLIDYILDSGRRLISPVGGGSIKRFSDYKNLTAITKEQKLAHWMAFQTREYGHDFLSSTLPVIDFCKSIGIKTVVTADGKETVIENQIAKSSDLIQTLSGNPLNSPDLEPYIECIGKFKNLSDKPIGGACFGPFTLAGAILGMERLCCDCILDPDFLIEILSFITNILIEFAHECEDRGADFFWIAEPTAVLVSPKHFEKFSGEFIKKINDSISLAAFLHVPGDTNHLIEKFIKTGAQCLSLDSCINMREMAHFIPGNVVILGNVNSIAMLQDSPQEIDKKVTLLNREIRNFPNFIISSGGALSANTPEENIRTMFSSTKKAPVWQKSQYNQIDSLWRTMANKNFREISGKLSQTNYSGEVIAGSVEEALYYLFGLVKKGKRSQSECYKQTADIIKVLNTGIVTPSLQININENKYRIEQLINNAGKIFQECC
ncbi:hypothetical protein KJ966_08330 [bacterium]|nr:hypothetical protein [bacterium]